MSGTSTRATVDLEREIHWMSLYLRLPREGVIQYFPAEDDCEQHVAKLLWPGGPFCPQCQKMDVTRFPDSKKYWCAGCRTQFTLRSVSWFRGSHLTFRVWFRAVEIVLRAHARRTEKVTLTEVRFAQSLDVSRMTARRLLKRIQNELVLEGGGELGALLCFEPEIVIPSGVSLGGLEHVKFLRSRVFARR